jgi:hypothetical protein
MQRFHHLRADYTRILHIFHLSSFIISIKNIYMALNHSQFFFKFSSIIVHRLIILYGVSLVPTLKVCYSLLLKHLPT